MAKRGPKPVDPKVKVLKENICLRRQEWDEISMIMPGVPVHLALRTIVSRWLSIRRKRKSEGQSNEKIHNNTVFSCPFICNNNCQ